MTRVSSAATRLAAMLASDSGRAAGFATIAEMRRLGSADSNAARWLAGFLQGVLDGSRQRSAEAVQAVPKSASHRVAWTESVSTTLRFAVRVMAVEPHVVEGRRDGQSVALEVEHQRPRYEPGSLLAIWPTNDPDDVKRILKMLRVKPQVLVPTDLGMQPAWQALLERVDIGAVGNEALRRLARFARSAREARRLAGLVKVPTDTPRSLLALIRRHPSWRPPLEEIVSTLGPPEPSLVPLVSSCLEHSNLLLVNTFAARNAAGGATIGAVRRDRLRPGQWLSVSIVPPQCSVP